MLKTLKPPPIRFGAEKELIPDAKVIIVEVITAGVITGHITSKILLALMLPFLLQLQLLSNPHILRQHIHLNKNIHTEYKQPQIKFPLIH